MNYEQMPDEQTLLSTKANLEAHGFGVIITANKEEALAKLKELIPQGAEVMTGSSTTLIELGFIKHLESPDHSWKSLHKEIGSASDDSKRSDLRRRHSAAEYFLGSVNAISQTGELVACDASGSRVSAYPFAAKHLILVSGTQKIVPNLELAMKRVREYVFPLEDARALKAYGMHSTLGKWVILEREFVPKRITLVLVKEKLGF